MIILSLQVELYIEFRRYYHNPGKWSSRERLWLPSKFKKGLIRIAGMQKIKKTEAGC